MKQITGSELVSAVPVAKPTMTRAEKLRHWASLVRTSKYPCLGLYHRLEHMTLTHLAHASIHVSAPTAFGVALGDPKFAEQGFSGGSTIKGAMDFFELSQAELHEFSCDCGGAITNADMADRIERLAGPSPAPVVDSSSWTGRVFGRLMGH